MFYSGHPAGLWDDAFGCQLHKSHPPTRTCLTQSGASCEWDFQKPTFAASEASERASEGDLPGTVGNREARFGIREEDLRGTVGKILEASVRGRKPLLIL